MSEPRGVPVASKLEGTIGYLVIRPGRHVSRNDYAKACVAIDALRAGNMTPKYASHVLRSAGLNFLPVVPPTVA